MNIKSFFSLLFILFFIYSCKEELQPQDNSDAVYAEPPANQTSTTPTTENVPVAPAPQSITSTAANQTVAPIDNQQPRANIDQSGINPAHGKPGHRCDIPVGAPLNSPPGKNPAAQVKAPAATPATTITTTNTISPATTAGAPAILKTNPVATPTAPGMNPAHGQEGHRCDIAVGAPLPKS